MRYVDFDTVIFQNTTTDSPSNSGGNTSPGEKGKNKIKQKPKP